MNNYSFEQEISLKDLLFFVLRKWRMILIIAIGSAFLLAGYKMVKDRIRQQDEEYIAKIQKTYDVDMRNYQQTKTGYEIDINNLNANIEYEEKYQKNSLLQQLDPYDKWEASADVFVKVENQSEENGLSVTVVDPADSIVKAYASMVQRGDYLMELSRSKNIGLNYLRELIDVVIDYDGNMFTVYFTYKDKEGAEEFLNTILDNLKNASEVKDHLESHKFVIMNQSVSKSADPTLAEIQRGRIENLTIMYKNLDELRVMQESLKEPKKALELTKINVLKSGMKYGVLGGILGGFLACFFTCIVFFTRNSVASTSELKNRTGLKILGVFNQNREKKVFSNVDKWLDRLEGNDYICEADVYDRIAVNIANDIEKNQTVLVSGTAGDDTLRTIEANLKRILPDVQFLQATVKSKHLINMLPKVGGVILVEKRGASKYREIQNEIEDITNFNKKIIGVIVL